MPDTQVQPVSRGKTWYGTSGTIDTSDYGTSVGLEGAETVFKDTDPADVTKARSSRDVRAIFVRNVSGITLLPSMAVVWSVTGKRVNGYADVTAAAVAGIVDDHYGTSTGVRNGDMFWLVTKGPCLVYTTTGTSGFDGNTWAVGDLIYSVTGASSTANTIGGTTADEGGKPINVIAASLASSTQLGYVLMNRWGRAISAATSGETHTRKLVDLNVEV